MGERRLRSERELLVLAAQHAEQRRGSRRAPRARCPPRLRTPARRRRAACARARSAVAASATIEASASLTRWWSSPAIRARSAATAPAARASRSSSAAAALSASAWLSFTRARTSRPSRIGPADHDRGHEEEVTSAARWMVEADRDRRSRRRARRGRPGTVGPRRARRASSRGSASRRTARRGSRRPGRPRRSRTVRTREGDRDRDHRRPPAHGERAGEREQRGAGDQQVAAGRVDEEQLDLHLQAQHEREEPRPGQPVDEPWHANAIRRREGRGGIPEPSLAAARRGG